MGERLGKRGPIPKPLSEAIEASSVVVSESGCWIWMGATTNAGYGKIRIGSVVDGSRVVTTAHRASWLAFNGEPPGDAFVCHRCDVPLCVNPDHLFLGTHEDNMADMARKKRQPGPNFTRETHPRTKIKTAAIADIRKLAKSLPHRQIAMIYGVSRSTISTLLRNCAGSEKTKQRTKQRAA